MGSRTWIGSPGKQKAESPEHHRSMNLALLTATSVYLARIAKGTLTSKITIRICLDSRSMARPVIHVTIFFFFFSNFWLCCTACGIFVPQPGIKLVFLAVEAWSPNHWTTRQAPCDYIRIFLGSSQSWNLLVSKWSSCTDCFFQMYTQHMYIIAKLLVNNKIWFP